MTSPYIYMPIRELAEMVKSCKVSPVELIEIFLTQLKNNGGKYNAVVTITSERALNQARQAEKEIKSGKYRGYLHGIPYGVKDLVATSDGIPTSWGAAPFQDRLFNQDGTVIRKLEEAGAILAAKLSMVELAGGMGYRQPRASFSGPGITPWAEGMWSGGSSSGSGAAVSAGLLPFAIGSETWGSILGPASHCGIAGLRPTYGRVSRSGAMALCWTLDKLGPLCQTADDCGLVLQAIAGRDPKDPTTTHKPYVYQSGHREPPFRLGIIKDVTSTMDNAVCINFERAVAALGEIATVETIEIPDLPYEEITRTILFAEAYSAFENFIEKGDIAKLTAPEDHYLPYARAAILAQDYIRALRLRGIMAREIDHVMEPFDAFIGPSRSVPPTPVHEDFRSAVGASAKDLMGAIGNGAGLPSISVPAGFTDTGLPTGIQFMGRPFEENTIIDIARSYQSITNWCQQHPPGCG